MQGIVLHNSDASISTLGMSEDGIHGIDTVYNLQTGSRLTIKGKVNYTDLVNAEKDINGVSTNYLGRSYVFLCESKTDEIYYQSIVDDTGYYEFVIRVPNRYIRTLENINFYILAVSSHFGDNYQYKVKPKSIDGGVPIFWGKSLIQDLSNVTLPYTLDLTATSNQIRMNNKAYPTQLNQANWFSDVFDVLKKDSGVVVTYKPYAKTINQLEAEVNLCGVK